jgi:PilZ domain
MTDRPQDRRHTRRRHHADDHRIVSARVRPGREAAVIDVSAGGALVETAHRLLPGTTVELHLETPHQRATVRGRVLRCAVAHLRSSSVCYRGAIGFDRHLPWFVDDEGTGYAVHGGETRPGAPARAAATPTLL